MSKGNFEVRKKNDLLDALTHHPIFSVMVPSDAKLLLNSAAEIHLDRGEVLYTSGEMAEGVYVILSGAIQIEYPQEGMRRGPVVAILPAPGFLGECQALGSLPWSGTGVAVVPTTVLRVRVATFIELLKSHHKLCQNLYLELAQRFLGAIEHTRHDAGSNLEQSVVRYVMAIDEITGGGGEIELTQAELAQATGVRRESVNRVFAQWKSAGLGCYNKGILKIVNRAAMTQLLDGYVGSPLLRHCSLPKISAVSLGKE